VTGRGSRNPPSRQEEHALDEPPWATSCSPEAELAKSLIALHRAERAPDRVIEQVAIRMDAQAAAPARPSLAWLSQLGALRRQVSADAGAWLLAAALAVLVTWHQRAAQGPWDASGDPAPAAADPLTGIAVPGSLERRIYGDAWGAGHCEGQFLVRPEGQLRAVRVHWTRCDLPDALSSELRRSSSPREAAAPGHVSLWGSWRRAEEFDAVRFR
jgi:hypothetical protein